MPLSSGLKKRAIVSWSSGKDSAWMLHALRGDPDVEIAGLLTTFNESADRVAMHAVRRELARAQARAVNLPLFEVDLPAPCSNEKYEEIMGEFVAKAHADGVDAVAFGDLYLEDIRHYREEQLKESGLQPLFPIWCGKKHTPDLAKAMIQAGFRSRLTCVDTRVLSEDFLGRVFDSEFLADLPAEVDPCGENGEFHSFCFDAPIFDAPMEIELGEIHRTPPFSFRDLLAST